MTVPASATAPSINTATPRDSDMTYSYGLSAVGVGGGGGFVGFLGVDTAGSEFVPEV